MLPSGTVTFLFTDIEGSTRLWEQHPEAMRLALARHDHLLRACIEEHAGHVFKTMGDAFCSVFARPGDAVAAVLAAQRALQREDWPELPGGLKVRTGLHPGQAEERAGDYFGPPLNRVARILQAAHGGQVLLSLAARDLAQDSLPDGASLRDLGQHRLKDLQQPERLFQLLHPELPTEFPALRSLEAFRHNLPRQLTNLVGRERELVTLGELLDESVLLTLTGAGGCGKTRMALQLAADCVDEYADGVWLVELAALRDPALVPQAVGAALQVREEPGKPLTGTLIDHLRAKRLLLMLDNCEHLLPACASLAEALLQACPELRVLATSREGFNIHGERLYRVPSLSLPPLAGGSADPQSSTGTAGVFISEAVRLFAQRAVMHSPGFDLTDRNAADVAEVCRRLDGIPLAIELAAARVKTLPLEQIVGRLDDRFRLLTGGSRTALPRQQTLRALIDWSYDLLSEQERELLRLLSVFAGGWSLDSAEAIAGARDGLTHLGRECPPLHHSTTPSLHHSTTPSLVAGEVLDMLAALVDKSLVAFDEGEGGGRYRMLETIRQYAAERLTEAGDEIEARRRHRAFFLAMAEQAEPELTGAKQAEWLGRLEREHENLRGALRSCGETEADDGLRLAGALWRFWYVRGHFGEGREWLREAIARNGVAARGKALNGAGGLAFGQGDYATARRYYEESLAISRESGEPREIAVLLNNLGLVARHVGNQPAAGDLYREAVALFREIGDRPGLASTLSNLGIVARHEGQYAAARALYEESLAIRRDVGDRWGVAYSLDNLGNVVRDQGDIPAARALHEESLTILRELADRRGIAYALEAFASLSAAGSAGMSDSSGPPDPITPLLHHSITPLERAAALWGAAEALRERIGAPLPLPERKSQEREIAVARGAVGDGRFAAAWERGRAMDLERAIEYALEQK